MLSLMIHTHPRLTMPLETRFLVKTWLKHWDYPISGAGQRPTPKLIGKFAR
jgi:hypothetical protein